jgi:hypothetical protein
MSSFGITCASEAWQEQHKATRTRTSATKATVFKFAQQSNTLRYGLLACAAEY